MSVFISIFSLFFQLFIVLALKNKITQDFQTILINEEVGVDHSGENNVAYLTYDLESAVKNSFNGFDTCTVEHDCVTNNSIGVSGTPPKCVCDCKPGWNGTKCDQKITLPLSTQLGYTSEYFITCNLADTWDNAVKRCQSYGDGWDIATIPGQEADSIIFKTFHQDIWLGANDISNPGSWRWQAGRLKNQMFWQKYIGWLLYCNWIFPPNDTKCENHALHWLVHEADKYGWVSKTNVSINDSNCSKVPSCVACERSLCNTMDIACNLTNTINITGYFPLCKCQCKSGYENKTCDDRVCSITNDCNNNAKSVHGTYPNCVCICKPGWGGKSCNVVVSTKPVTTIIPQPTLPTTASTSTFSPGLKSCPFRGIYPCIKASAPFNVQRGNELWPKSLDLGALLSVGQVYILLPVWKGIPFHLNQNDTELLSKSVTEEGVTSDVPYRREEGAAFYIDRIGYLSDIFFILFNGTSPGSVIENFKKIPPELTLRFISSSLVNKCCNGSNISELSFIGSLYNLALDVGKISVLSLPETLVDKRAISKNARAAINEGMKYLEVTCKNVLLGTSWVELTAAAPLGRLLPIDAPYYVRAIAANVILVIVVTIVHLVIVIMLSKGDSSHTFAECCARARFPSVTIGCLFAVSPGTAIAAGGLLGTWSGTAEGCDVYPNDNDTFAHIMALIGVLVIIGTFVFTLVYPKIYISRSLMPVPLLPGVRRSRVELLFPATVVLPYPRADMFHSLIGTIRLPGLVWPSVPMWSSVVLFIFAILSPNAKLFEILLIAAILHFMIIIAILLIRPFYALSLNIIHCFGLLPIALLLLIRGALIKNDCNVKTDNKDSVVAFSCLVSFAIVTRLLLYIVQPFSSFFLLSTTPDPSITIPPSTMPDASLTLLCYSKNRINNMITNEDLNQNLSREQHLLPLIEPLHAACSNGKLGVSKPQKKDYSDSELSDDLLI